MSDELTVRERAALLAFLVHQSAENVTNNELYEAYGLALKAKERERLERFGYVAAVRGPGPGNPFLHELTDAGRVRAEKELGETPEAGRPLNSKVAYALFNRIHEFLERNYMDAATIFGAKRRTAHRVDVRPELEEAITAAYEKLAPDSSSWVSLKHLREVLSEVSRPELDEALTSLYSGRKIRMTTESNRKTLQQPDKDAALTIAGEDKHLISIG